MRAERRAMGAVAAQHSSTIRADGDGLAVQAKFPRGDEVIGGVARQSVGVSRAGHEQVRIRCGLQETGKAFVVAPLEHALAYHTLRNCEDDWQNNAEHMPEAFAVVFAIRVVHPEVVGCAFNWCAFNWLRSID